MIRPSAVGIILEFVKGFSPLRIVTKFERASDSHPASHA